ncbi:2-oxoglutarate-dependent dioxygenase 19-like isoform X2 [Telopea speciosissima]|uniref:2-oxoglutarate-dependent dioxygenase 19-like isoform X2 n=1 Tax=Telopea speciosissima TaxID=54955 RepID=UPI001CC55F17|nr:2-oxoglutarate-dependent dioxygenase 19-like isoform X2 [Telopea speciosissima]
MAAKSQILVETPSSASSLTPPMSISCVKELVESNTLITSIPSNYIFSTNLSDDQVVTEELPIIDFSLLTSGSPDQRSKIVHELGKACQDWGFFMVINHGVPENLREEMLNACQRFFDLTEEEKREYAGKHVTDPIRCGTSFNASVEKVFFWRDFLKVFVHPEFHSPGKPPGFSKRTRQVAIELLKGISESLGLQEYYIDNEMKLEKGFQILAGNLYPPCPEPELAMGMPPHSDHGLLTLLIDNCIGGLQIQHKGKWVQVNSLPNSFLVNIGDHLEILSNGKYKSVLHRAKVNDKTTRVSLAIAHGPSLDTVVSPAPELLNSESNKPAYSGMKYRDYMELQQGSVLNEKTSLDRVRVK